MSDPRGQVLTVTNRTNLCMNGILRVLGFDDDYVLLESEEGRITVEGSGLVIESLTKETGEIEICGKIFSVAFSDNKRERRSFFGLVQK